MILANFRSIISKQDDLLCSIDTCSADVVVGTETWLSQDVSDCELCISNSFRVYRKDRSASRGGGVIIAVKNELISSLIDIHGSLGIIWVTVRLNFRPCLISMLSSARLIFLLCRKLKY